MKADFLSLYDFTGQRACVTGAASGIGHATALLLDALGAHVIAGDRDEEGLAALRRQAPSIQTHVYDQACLDSVETFASAVGSVDIFVNNAAVFNNDSITEVTMQEVNRVIQVNLINAIALTKLFGAPMLKRQSGCLLMTCSQLAFHGAENRSAYTASKAAMIQFIKSAALEWGRHGVRVNGVAPGRTLTPMNRHLLADPQARQEGLARIPLGRYGEPGDIAQAITFMCSGAASYITGHVLLVDGGWVLP